MSLHSAEKQGSKALNRKHRCFGQEHHFLSKECNSIYHDAKLLNFMCKQFRLALVHSTFDGSLEILKIRSTLAAAYVRFSLEVLGSSGFGALCVALSEARSDPA